MPIRPEMRPRYPADWKAIRLRILTRADHKCECVGQCGDHAGQRCAAPNLVWIRRSIGEPWKWSTEQDRDRVLAESGRPGTHSSAIRVVLTIAHLVDKRPEACEDSNLAALCQRCHLRLDAPDRLRGQVRS